VLFSKAQWEDFTGNSEYPCLTVVLLSIAKWKGFAAKVIQSGVKNEKMAGCHIFFILSECSRRKEGDDKRPPELPVAKSLPRSL